MVGRETLKDHTADLGSGGRPPPVPGVVLVYSGDQPLCVAWPLDATGLEIGRSLRAELEDDERMSRRHAQVAFEDGRFRVTDLDSSNGSYVDGERVRGTRLVDRPAVLRLGQTLFLCLPDVAPLLERPVRLEPDGVVGPQLARAFERIDVAARTCDTLLILGDSGTGKELAARRFHARSPRSGGPFVAVNCATIPEGIAERLLFGAKRGAFSGAVTNADGYLVAADGGTLFLDELGELDLAVQPKLLRVLETREVIPLGDTRGRQVSVGICAATLRDIPERVGEGKFREDLYYRMGRPAVRLPALRDRREEIPFLVHLAISSVGPTLYADALLIESCLLRPWPGNVRELLGDARHAAHLAVEKGRSQVDRLDLATAAGLSVKAAEAALVAVGMARPGGVAPAEAGGTARAGSAGASPQAPPFPHRDQIEEVLRRERGNVTRAAQQLGLHRNQLRRWLARQEADPRAGGVPDESGPGAGEAPRDSDD
jgi:transcriptional regulator with GAF, ATPase, and Fis domain